MPSPLRFIHTGDLHLDSPFRGLMNAAPAPVARPLREATIDAWRRIVVLAVEEAVDFVVVAGDVFEAETRTLRGQLAFVEGLRGLERAGIPAFVVTGNHEPLSGWEPSVALPPNTHRFSPDAVEGRAGNSSEPRLGPGPALTPALTARLLRPVRTPSSALVRTVVIGEWLLRPRVGDLLEDLAHAGAEELAALGVGLMVSPPHAGRLARVELLIVVHAPMLGLVPGCVKARVQAGPPLASLPDAQCPAP